MKCPKPVGLSGEDALALAKLFAAHCYLPNPDTAKALPTAIFPTLRDPRRRLQTVTEDNRIIGMYDDNTTPRWALLWSHGIASVAHQRSWQFAHVWPSSNDLRHYTRVANLAMVPESFGGLTDKVGPLVAYLRWHAWQEYRWSPEERSPGYKPHGYDEISWRYLPRHEDPRAFIKNQLERLNNQTVNMLRTIINQA